MGLDIFKYLLPSQQSRVEEELALLKEKKLTQDKIRFSEEEQKLITAEDQAKLAELHPIPRILVCRTVVKARDFGLRLGIHSGMRSYQAQELLYSIGRDSAGNIIDQKAVVTNAKPGYSWHNYGLAVDLVMDGSPKPGLQWSWDAQDANQDGQDDWDQLGVIGETFGLGWGGRFKKPAPVDKPHFQYHNGIGSVEEALHLFRPAGPMLPGIKCEIEAVWAAIV